VSTAVLLVLLACACAYAVSLMRRHRSLEAELDEIRAGCMDPQTLLGGPEAFRGELQLEVLRSARTGRPASLIVLRLEADPDDDAKREAQPMDLVGVLNHTLRAIDRRYRIGADEFALLLPETRARGGLAAARRVDGELQAADVGRITAGVAELGPGIDRQLAFRHAYCAFLGAGQNGRSTILAYSPELNPNAEWSARLDVLPEIEPA
jgi:predicted signal transduction protein with EAL and GGDEF domain